MLFVLLATCSSIAIIFVITEEAFKEYFRNQLLGSNCDRLTSWCSGLLGVFQRFGVNLAEVMNSRVKRELRYGIFLYVLWHARS